MVVMPSYPHIEEYYARLQELIQFGGSDNEQSIRPAFLNCLAAYCSDQREKLVLVPELAAQNGTIPDGTIKDSMRLDRGYWEAKDTHDNLDAEIQRKFNRGYPRDNIIFEDSRTAVLIQNQGEAMRVDMRNPSQLHRIIRAFLNFVTPVVADFRKAQKQFKNDLPHILEALRQAIRDAAANGDYQKALSSFRELCHRTIGPLVSDFDIQEMLIQHILTRDIFLRVFSEDQFHQENNIARQLDTLAQTFFTGVLRRNTIDELFPYYGAIAAAAAMIDDYHEKQHFLKAIYEDFYQAYNPAAADRLGVVYTPNEVVDFIIRGTDYLLQRHFGRSLADEKVQILDPATGTGTFITSLIDYLPPERLEDKYLKEIHANEVAILPYYIANLNIAYSYREKTGKYLEFPNLCFVDTLDNLDWQKQGATGGAVVRQSRLALGALSEENWIRVQEQNEKSISVIIGNPPYNANQQNENDNNKNREYPEIDRRISDTYIAASTAQKTKQYDMYKRFIRWASDRLDDDGVIGFVTNRAYLEARQDDGFRQVAAQEFTDIYILDLGSDVRRNPKISGTTHNVFGIQTGVAIGFFVRDKSRLGQCSIRYARREDSELKEDKLTYLREAVLNDVEFEEITPDKRNEWLNQSSSDFEQLLPLANRETKLAKKADDERAVFGLYSMGVVTNRDEWVYDFSSSDLSKKVRAFIKEYEDNRGKYGGKEVADTELGTVIKWTRDLKRQLRSNARNRFNRARIRQTIFRPFVNKSLYFSQNLNEMQYQLPDVFPKGSTDENKAICFCVNGKAFYVLAADKTFDLHLTGDTQCLPLYRYTEDGKRVSNITEWGIRQFNEHYRKEWGDAFEELAGPAGITAEDIFAYTYAVLHDPVYRHDYRVDLLREFPRLPFYHEFDVWKKMGQELLDLHIGFEEAEPWPLRRTDETPSAGRRRQRMVYDEPKVVLQAGKQSGSIYLDDETTLMGVPPEAWEYQLGSRSALEWVLDQYKEKRPRDPTIAEKFNTYRFADYKEQVIDLLRRVCTVSVKTVEIVGRMAYWEGDELRAFGDRERDDFTTAALVQWAKEPEDAEWLEELREIWLETSSESDCP